MAPAVDTPSGWLQERALRSRCPAEGPHCLKGLWKSHLHYVRAPIPAVLTSHSNRQGASLEEEAGVSFLRACNPDQSLDCPAGSRNQPRGQKRCWRKPEREAGASLSSCTATGQCPVLSPGPGCGRAASPPRVQFTAEEAAEAEEETQVSVGLRRQRGGVSACPSSLGTSVGRWPPLQLPPHPAIHLDISAPCCPSAAPPEVTCDVPGVDISGQDARPCFRSSPPPTLVPRQLSKVTGCKATHDNRWHLRPPTTGVRRHRCVPLHV